MEHTISVVVPDDRPAYCSQFTDFYLEFKNDKADKPVPSFITQLPGFGDSSFSFTATSDDVSMHKTRLAIHLADVNEPNFYMTYSFDIEIVGCSVTSLNTPLPTEPSYYYGTTVTYDLSSVTHEPNCGYDIVDVLVDKFTDSDVANDLITFH